MKLHSLPSSHKRVQRIGRGGKRGTTAGRGTKGQKSRAGNRRRPAERDLILRIPKMRGFRNKPKTDTVTVFSLDTLSKKLKSYAKAGVPLEIDVTLLKAAGLLGKKFNGRVKILADGEMGFSATVKGIKISKSAQAKLEGVKR
jgi:large subunit ribosomal protein L15